MAKKPVATKIEETVDVAFTAKCKQEARNKGAVMERFMLLYSSGIIDPFDKSFQGKQDDRGTNN